MARYYPECRINLSVVFDGFGGRDRPVVIEDIIPISASVKITSYKEADTWEVSFDSKRFPFSPELVRSAAIEIYMYQREDLTEEPFKPVPIKAIGPVASLAAEILNNAQTLRAQQDRLICTGLVDNISLSQDDGGGVVTMSGRDYTALMLDKQWDPEKSGKRGRIPDGPLEGVIQDLVDEAVHATEVGRTLTVQTYDFDFEIKTHNVSKNVTQKKVTVKPPPTHKSRSKRKKRGIAVKSDSNYWDVIYKLALSYGYIVYVRGWDVVIAKPHVLYADQENTYGYWRVAYGRNLESLEVERKLSKEAVPQIRVRSYDPKAKIAIEGRFPSDDQKGDFDTDPTGKKNARQVMTGVGTKKEEYRVYTVPDITDVNTLKEIARSTYYTLARGEGMITFTTPALRDLDARDLLGVRAGDAVQIVWDAFNSEIMTSSDLGTDQKVSALLAQGYKIDVARLVAEQYEKLDYFRQNFYVKTAQYDWASDNGIKITVEAINFINAQRDGQPEIK